MPFAWRTSTQWGVRKLADVRHAGLKVCKLLILLCADAGHPCHDLHRNESVVFGLSGLLTVAHCNFVVAEGVNSPPGGRAWAKTSMSC
jgi:hypothetical protein